MLDYYGLNGTNDDVASLASFYSKCAHENQDLNDLQLFSVDQSFIDECKFEEKIDKIIFHSNNCVSCEYDSMEDSPDFTVGPVNVNCLESDQKMVFERNNFGYETKIGVGKEDISCASRYPPQLDPNITIGAYDGSHCTNVHINGKQKISINSVENFYVDIESSDDYTCCNVLSDTDASITTSENGDYYLVTALGEYRFIPDEIEYHSTQDEIVIKNKQIKWWLTVPIHCEDGTIRDIRVFADPGADCGCVKTEWAVRHFPTLIRRNTRNAQLFTPSGSCKPKFVISMTFPRKDGKIIRSRMYLMDHLPVPVLIDINLLRAFGYSFKDEKPAIFYHHSPEPDIEFDLKEQENYSQVVMDEPDDSNWFNGYKQRKEQFYAIKHGVDSKTNDPTHTVNTVLVPSMFDTLKANNKLLYHHTVGSLCEQQTKSSVCSITGNGGRGVDIGPFKNMTREDMHVCEAKIPTTTEKSTTGDSIVKDFSFHFSDRKRMINLFIDNYDDFTQLDDLNVDQIDYLIRCVNDGVELGLDKFIVKRDYILSKAQDPTIYPHCMFITAKQDFLASEKEIKMAEAIFDNPEIPWNTWEYLKEYPKTYGPRFNGLYSGVNDLVKRYSGCFAGNVFDRRTMVNVPHARLGIRPEFRHKTMYARQYPIDAIKRLHMINYTKVNADNGFWDRVERSLHAVPYTMVPKKRDGVIFRYRPAFDGRVVNQWCELLDSNMPTIKDFRDIHSIIGFTTALDIKNCFDCIPLHYLDQPYAVAMTPLGLYRMNCLTYGWKNAAPNAQNIMNTLAMFVGNTLAYIDDICIKHPLEEGTPQILARLERALQFCEKRKILLNRRKFIVCAEECTSFGFKWTVYSRQVSQAYANKVILAGKPTTGSECDTLLGALGYIGDEIYGKAILTYWIQQMSKHCGKGKLKWTPQAEIAWEMILFQLHNLPVLHHPTRDGKFCIKTDACNYGCGAVLYQQQKDPSTGKLDWKIIDMCSKIMPTNLRHCHSMIHEAYALVYAVEHWQFHLIKRRFAVSTDNEPVANIFARRHRDMNAITQRQLLRLRIKLCMFDFDIYHVDGLKNEIADKLSRHVLKLFNKATIYQALGVVAPNDNGDKPLTPADDKHLEQFKLKSEKLRSKMHELSKSNTIAALIEQFPGPPDEHINNRHDQLRKDLDADWNQLLKAYRESAFYVERPAVNLLLDNESRDLLRSDEYSFNSEPFAQFQKEMEHILHGVHFISHEARTRIKHILHGQQFESQKQHLILACHATCYHEDDDSNTVAAIGDREWKIGDELDSDDEPPPTTSRSRVITRSMTQHARRMMDSTSYRLDNVHFDNVRGRMRTRDEFMHEIFGHRRDIGIFDNDRFIKYQDDDNVLALVKKMLTVDKLHWNETDLRFIAKWDRALGVKLQNNSLRVENGLLQVKWRESLTRQLRWVHVVPFILRGKFMDWAHHNLQLHHASWSQTYDQLNHKYWWSTMKRDVREFCRDCVSCQFTKGGVRHRAPLRMRDLPLPRHHIFADFLGSVFGKYYILFLVDYATGYTMLIPTEGTDAVTVVDSILKRWVPIFGWFKIFESDWGSGFNSNIMKALGRAAEFKIELAEPRNHRSIGKVERIIGVVQSILNQYNLLLDEKWTNNVDEFEKSWETIETILPFIQLALNQRRPRFTTISPNMLMFGTNLNDISDIGRITSRLEQCYEDDDISTADHKYLHKLIVHLEKVNEAFQTDWKNYTWLSIETYDKKWAISPERIENYRNRYLVDRAVLYFVGDKREARGKWKQKWTGPWRIAKQLNDSTVIITDPSTGDQKRVSYDRIKIYNAAEKAKYRKYEGKDDDYLMYQARLQDTLSRYNVKKHSKESIRKKKVNLDYTQRDAPRPTS